MDAPFSSHSSAEDLRRLEPACGPALEQRDTALEVDVDVSGIGETSRLFLVRLVGRGAVLT
jgi:hypothetical protein